MTLKETFSKYILTEGQSTLLEELDIFLSDRTKCFLLKGYAGTGKTFMMKGFVDFLKENKRSFKIAAPTGRAAKVISQKTNHRAYTIHKTIYSSKDLKEFKTKDKDGTETFKFYYDIKNNEDPKNTIYIIDEASMLSNVYSEGEFFRFGTGYLLNDLIKYINFDNSDHQKKVIFIGDNAQLPPVNMNFSPALDSSYLKENCNLNGSEIELTEVIRQNQNSGILQNATKLRESIKSNIFNKLQIETSLQDCIKTEHEDLMSKYVKACNDAIDEDTIIIAYSNGSVKQYNDLVRKHFFPDKDIVTEGDKLLLVSNNYNHGIELLNGDVGFVKRIKGESERRKSTLKIGGGDTFDLSVSVEIIYRDVEIEFKDIDDISQIVDCKIVESLLYSEHRDLSSNEQKAMYIDFWIRNPKLNQIRQLLHAKSINYEKLNDVVRQLSPNDVNPEILEKIKKFQKEYFDDPNKEIIREISVFILKDALKSDPYFNALRVKFGYAITCNKAQGGEWKNTFVNYKTSMGYFNSHYFRWAYTATTRAKERLYCIDPPLFGILDGKIPADEIQYTERQDLFILSKEITEFDIPFGLEKEDQFLQQIFCAVWEVIKDTGINIDKVIPHSYTLHFYFSDTINKAIFHINYNKKNKITHILLNSDKSEFAERLNLLLQKLSNKYLVLAGEQTAESTDFVFEFPEDKPFLKDLFDKQTEILESTGIKIVSITHYNYNDEYKYAKNGFFATIIFDYKKNGRFTTKRPDLNKTTSAELLAEIIKLLQNDN